MASAITTDPMRDTRSRGKKVATRLSIERQTANAEGVALWRRTLALVKELQNTTPLDGSAIH